MFLSKQWINHCELALYMKQFFMVNERPNTRFLYNLYIIQPKKDYNAEYCITVYLIHTRRYRHYITPFQELWFWDWHPRKLWHLYREPFHLSRLPLLHHLELAPNSGHKALLWINCKSRNHIKHTSWLSKETAKL